MATDEHTHTITGAEDFPAHSEGYARFIWWLKTSSVLAAITTVIVIFLITR